MSVAKLMQKLPCLIIELTRVSTQSTSNIAVKANGSMDLYLFVWLIIVLAQPHFLEPTRDFSDSLELRCVLYVLQNVGIVLAGCKLHVAIRAVL